MHKAVDYYFTPASPWTYLGHQRFEAMARHRGAMIRYKPVDFGRIFPASGGLPLPKRAPQRQAYRLVELERWRKHLGVELNLNPKFFPTPSDLAAKFIIAAHDSERGEGLLAFAFMRACWAEERNIADPATLVEVATHAGYDGESLGTAAGNIAVSKRYDDLTQEAIGRQVFGAPFFIYRDEPFWGQDRLDFLDRALAQ
jgi:2-hydroxychromene-2-carboxylate isomerase